jgi:predicted pyridoxine 5'-phosphate oxidase superfamily flavin-nucleotide-binding protein
MNTVEQHSPFHAGELEMQRRVGVDERIEDIGRRVIRGHLLPQHQEFYQAQHMLLLALTDSGGRPWAAVAAGSPGFVTAIDAHHLRIDALPVGLSAPPGAGLAAELVVGARVGALGIDYATRRRNRVNGRVISVDRSGFVMQVTQSFGNCPKYIQLRDTEFKELPGWRAQPVLAHRVPELHGEWRALIESSDHFFIASNYDRPGDDAHHGADVSHRGGKPGFVRIGDDGALEFPDFAGNRFYNTLGNISANGKAALLFIDLHSGSLLSMSGEARVDWGDAQSSGFAGAERTIRFVSHEARAYGAALPLSWRYREQSPALAHTGDWPSSIS